MLERMNRMLKDEGGFTLIEMIVVIVLVAVLAAVAVPLYATYATKGRASEANSIMSALVSAADAYYSLNDSSYTGFDQTHAEWQRVTRKARYFSYTGVATGSGDTATLTITATGNNVDPKLSGQTLAVTVNAAGANTWTASGEYITRPAN